jgi:hypothetical protein
VPFFDLQRQSQHDDSDQAGSESASPNQPTRPAATAAAPDDGQSDWPVPGWQWASLVAVLLGGQLVLLVLTTWTLATSASYGRAIPIILALGLLARLIPDTLSLAEWAATATSWTPPVDRHPPGRGRRRARAGQPGRDRHMSPIRTLHPSPPPAPAGTSADEDRRASSGPRRGGPR